MKLEVSVPNIPITRKVFFILFIHFIIWIIGITIVGFYHILASRIFSGLYFIGEILFTVLIVISVLDYLDILKFRKSVERKTKCVICGRVTKSKYEFEKLIKTEIIDSKKEGKTEKTTTEHETSPSKPFDGIIVSDKPVCTDCVKKVKEIG